MGKIRFGLVGVGNIGSAHGKALFSGEIPGAQLTAVLDVDPKKQQWTSENLPGVLVYGREEDFFSSAQIDALLIATPHYFHPSYAVKAFGKGWHVLSEKPAGVQCSAVTEMISAARISGKRFGMMFNQRTDPMYGEIRRLVQSGALGQPLRLLWQATHWYRTQDYYDSGAWRATWSGEGGGVLMNQAPHQLDLLQWIFGLPKTVSASCPTGKYHSIEVEDEATLFLTYENGATAVFHTSTGEKNGINRLEIVGTSLRLVAEHRVLSLYEGKTLVSSHTYEDCGEQHRGILTDFTEGIAENRPFLAEGEEGIRSLQIANAAYLSAWTGQTVTLPADPIVFDGFLKEKQKNSRGTSFFSSESSDGVYKARWQNS